MTTVTPFLFKPSWADIPPAHAHQIKLDINPKMSFGTGYHESTRLALRFLPAYVSESMRVLDAGAGTGILAIAAAKLGAGFVLAFDIDEWSLSNASENVRANEVQNRVEIRTGTVEVIPEKGFDLILANINRSVLIELLPVFRLKMAEGAHLILAGLLNDDRQRMLHEAFSNDLTLQDEASENEWWSGVFKIR